MAPFTFKRPHWVALARIIRYSMLPEMHKKKFVRELIPYLLEDNTSFDYEWFYRMSIGADYKGEPFEI